MFLRAVEVGSVILFIEKPINSMYEVQRTTLRDGGFSRNTGLWVRINAHDVTISRHSQRAVLSIDSSWASRRYSASSSTIPYSMKNQLHASLPTSRLLLCSLNFLMQNLGCEQGVVRHPLHMVYTAIREADWWRVLYRKGKDMVHCVSQPELQCGCPIPVVTTLLPGESGLIKVYSSK